MYIALLLFLQCILLFIFMPGIFHYHMVATMESLTRQNELEHQRRLHEKLRQELGPTICELLDDSTKPLKIRAEFKKKRKRSQRFRSYFERKGAAMLSLSVTLPGQVHR